MIKRRKKQNRFLDFQEKKQVEREVLITRYLEILRENKIHFRYITDVATSVAKHLTEKQNKPCSKTSILRNPRYKAILIPFFASQDLSKISQQIQNNSSVLELSSVRSELTILNMKREIARLKKHIEQSHTETKDCVSNQEDNVNNNRIRDLENDFVNVCHIALSLIKNFDTLIYLELDSNQILDRSEMVNRVICGAPRAIPFFNWLRQLPPQILEKAKQ